MCDDIRKWKHLFYKLASYNGGHHLYIEENFLHLEEIKMCSKVQKSNWPDSTF